MAKIRSTFGENVFQTSVSYQVLLEALNYPDLIDLQGYGIGEAEFDETDAVEVPVWRIIGGRLTPSLETIIGARVRKVTYPILLPQGRTLWNELLGVAGGDCPRDLVLEYLCPNDPQYEHFYVLPRARFAALKRTGSWVENADGSGTPLTMETAATVAREYLYYAVQLVEALDATAVYHAVAYASDDCVGCNPLLHQDAVVGGVNVLSNTANAFGSLTSALPGGFTATDAVRGLWVEGNRRFAGYGDGTAAGGILATSDGATYTDAYTGESIHGIVRAGGRLVAVGTNGTILESPDGSNWTAIPAAAYAAADFNGIDYDPASGNAYIVGTSGGAGIVLVLNRNNILTNITALVDAGSDSTALYAVRVFAPDHIGVGGFDGTNGFFAENPRYSEGDAFTVSLIGTAAVRGVVGDHWRQFVGTGSRIYRRDVNTQMTFTAMTAVGGVTISGNVTGATGGQNETGFNFAAFVTDAGEVLVIQPSTPSTL